MEADRYGPGPEIRSLRLTASLGLRCATFGPSPRSDSNVPDDLRLQGRGRDESTVNMRAFLAFEDHQLVYNELRGICIEYVQEAHRQM